MGISTRFGHRPATMAAAGLLLLLAPTLPARADLAAAEADIAARQYEAAIGELQPMADAGDSYAMWRLAEIYLAGHGGSLAEGMALLQQAATAGEPDAQARLGVMLAKGDGVAADNLAAYKWLSLAARGAAPGTARTLAETNLSVVGQRLSPEERAAAKSETMAAVDSYQAPAPAAPSTEPAPAAVETPPEPAATASLAVSYRVQLASIPNEEDVPAEWERLRKRIGAPVATLDLHVERADLGAQGVFYRLQAGPFATQAEATATCTEIRASGSDCLVVAP
ncbi:MAG: SPOR domain-containing protein [Rhodospirillaceae bacterium]|nr:SPOR domain-containing protein [Rhodospirillaceae bacterium]